MESDKIQPEIFDLITAFVHRLATGRTEVNKDFIRIAGFLDGHVEDAALIKALSKWPDELKILLVQQFFRHHQPGSHQTNFDLYKVNRLLTEWFNIEINETSTQNAGQAKSRFPGRVTNPGIYRTDFGNTQFYFHISEEHHLASQRLIDVISEKAILTTEKTSPPCEMSEIVPLWLKDRTLDSSLYYIKKQQEHFIATYFIGVQLSLLNHLGLDILEPSTEMAIVTNGDALRYHRDRLVNQYQFLDRLEESRQEYCVAQCLTLMSWDMQPETLSGTVFDHPDGQRYVFCLFPGEIANLIFVEEAQIIGTMMMPYHCALPVVDLSSEKSVGAAKGKRLSTVLRGLVKKQSLFRLEATAERLSLNKPMKAMDNYMDTVREKALSEIHFSEPTALEGKFVGNVEAAVSVIEINAAKNESLLSEMMLSNTEKARIFRLVKHSSGFTDLSKILPGYDSAIKIIVINRSTNYPPGKLCYPLAIDFTLENKPWIQLIPLAYAKAFEILEEHRLLMKLSPAEEIFHRSALIDSFHQLPVAKPYLSIVLDIVLIT